MVDATYAFQVVVEPDDGGWNAYCPSLREYGAVTQGASQEEALKNIEEVVHMIVDELTEEGVELPSITPGVNRLEGMHVAVIPSRTHV